MSKFEVGQVIHHRRYDYRGVIHKVDCECLAPDEWYLRNRTQPGREQSWYHVLVNAGAETYVAEENLELDESGLEIEHPYLALCFTMFINGRYHRFSPN